ncbi:hypothetical protein UFOVP1008_37 [uncultured Caudovirales phage]|uniref:Uncharacterized protein n=1 Tax=uncultured Caudovirales phage TaxID=2100421 RepID=A0A6J5MNG6_9CAUD|nr:hypothetical protein UFOVP498_45 [uncultured Caudovirales phage]CAB4177717.1 hypothetical protein UFOVP1008_37 [uncultured Caudovirales phage]CAB4187158.1 hypothetical protein UFOVP1160_9 [uncultured Caudovirales phage]CAB4200283.1 hypothetical protein UFOVP1352_41 [uncultured Caudovirales phage]
MAVIFTWPLTNMFLYQSFWSQWGLSGACAITAYSGAQPTAAQITSSYNAYSGQALIHWTGATWIQPTSPNSASETQQFMTLNVPTSKVAFVGGTAQWAILWGPTPAVTEAAVKTSALPSTIFYVVPVTDNAGKGVVKMTSTALALGSSYQPSDVTIRVGLV